MRQVLITFATARTFTNDRPLAVVVIEEDGKRSQDVNVACVRDGRIFGNGICFGHMGDRSWPVNPTVDPRLLEEV